jgi:hypothetical protein
MPAKNLLKKYVDVSCRSFFYTYIPEAATVIMKTVITEKAEELIIQLWYEGTPRQEIEKRTSASAGTINNVVQREKQLVGEGKVDALRKLSSGLRKEKANNSVDIMRATRFLNACNARDMDDEDVIECVPRLDQSCKKNNISLQDLPLDTESRVAKIQELDSTIAAKEKDAIEANKHREEALKKARLTEEGLSRFNTYMNMLTKRGLPLDPQHPEKFENALPNAEEEGYDVKSIIDEISQCRSLKQENAGLRAANLEHEAREARNKQITKEHQAQMAKNAELLGKVEQAENMYLGIPQLEVLIQAVTKVGRDNGIDAQSSVRKFTDDVSTSYDSKVGFARKIEEHKKQCSNLEAKIDKLKMDYAPHKDAVDSVATLHAKGVKDHEIVSLKNIIERSGVSNMKELEDDIKSYGGLKSAINELENQNKELLTRNLALKNQNELLECEQTSLKKTVENMGDFFKIEFNKYIDTIKAGTESIKSTIAESDKAMKHSTAELKRGTDVASIQIVKVLEAAKIGFQKILANQRLRVYEPFVRAERGEKVEGKAMVIALISAIDSAEPYLDSITNDSAKSYLRSARKELADTLEYFSSML